MMISPEGYYDIHLKDKDMKQIMTAIRGLKQEIGKLKNILENTDFNIGFNANLLTIFPSYSTRIHWTREYLKKAKESYIEIGGEYTPSKQEKKAIDFNENIKNINKLAFTIGGFHQGYKNYVVDISDCLKATLEYEDNISKIKLINDYNEPYNLEDFWDTLKNLYMGEWKRTYYDSDILDGEQWELKVYFSNKDKPIVFAGSNHYPYNFDSFKSIFENK